MPPSPSPRSSAGDGGAAETVARNLLGCAGARFETGGRTVDAPALAWRRAGLQRVTGRPGGPGLVSPAPLATFADGALIALRALAPDAPLPPSGAALLGERARRLGLRRRGAGSPNGSARLIAARDGLVVLNLPRQEDWASIPALLGEAAGDWRAIAREAGRFEVADLVAQGRLLGMAIAAEAEVGPPDTPFRVRNLGPTAGPRGRSPMVVDLSALWAGPLAASLLGAVGARVVKVESRRRPDGARGGDAGFYDLLNAGKASVALDFDDPDDRSRLRRLVAAADIVVESTRPRALEQLGIHAAQVAERGGVWLSITAYGRDGELGGRIGFGDDAAVAGGLTAAMRRGWNDRLFAGDAIADPLTGLTGAFAAWSLWRGGQGGVISVALAEVIAFGCALGEASAETVAVWQAAASADPEPLYPLRAAPVPARPLGADTAGVLDTL
jgi:hypothetical protein